MPEISAAAWDKFDAAVDELSVEGLRDALKTEARLRARVEHEFGLCIRHVDGLQRKVLELERVIARTQGSFIGGATRDSE